MKGVYDLQKYIVNEVLEVYRMQGVKINDKHVEVIVNHMLKKVQIINPNDSKFLIGEKLQKQLKALLTILEVPKSFQF